LTAWVKDMNSIILFVRYWDFFTWGNRPCSVLCHYCLCDTDNIETERESEVKQLVKFAGFQAEHRLCVPMAILLKKMSSFWQFFDIQMAIFRRVRIDQWFSTYLLLNVLTDIATVCCSWLTKTKWSMCCDIFSTEHSLIY